MPFIMNLIIIYMSFHKFLKCYGNLVCNVLKMSIAAVYEITFLWSIKNRIIFQHQNNYLFVFYTINLMLKKKI